MDDSYDLLADDVFRADALAKVDNWDFHDRTRWVDWRKGVGPCVRAIWHTFTDDQKIRIAADAHIRERTRLED